jgi:hypothetical protein
MEVHELIEQHRKEIDDAKVALSLCDYEQATLMVYLAYRSNRQLLEQVDAMKLEARTTAHPGGD